MGVTEKLSIQTRLHFWEAFLKGRISWDRGSWLDGDGDLKEMRKLAGGIIYLSILVVQAPDS